MHIISDWRAMYRIFILAAVTAVAVGRPELYKEQEDFKYSRSSSDEGSKSGYYGAQRGNMGGNYERAHNMDGLAQNQMSGLVRQVEGELGDGVNTRTGSVYSAANSQGTYGSGHYDVSNLAGRNFREGANYGSSNSHASQTQSKSSFSNAGNTQNYGALRYGGYQRATADAHTQTDDLQSIDNSQTNNQLEYGKSTSHSSGYQSHSGFQKHSEYDSSNANSNSGYGSNVRTRLVNASPVRIILTPGGRVAIPIAAQTYDAAQHSSAFDHNALNSEAELTQNNQGSSYTPTNVKSYESSYSYKKKWEKHDNIPSADIVVGHTASPIPGNSELYEDGEARNQYNSGVDSQSAHANIASSRYNAVKSSSNSRYQSNYNTQRSDSAISSSNLHGQARYHAGSNHDASISSSNNYHGQYGSRHHGVSSASSDAASQTEYNAGSHSDLNSQVEDLNLKPKSYQSSYSYHKSWERQGDPYTIYPASNGYSDSQSSQRLSSLSQSAAHHSRVSHAHDLEDCDCDENGHIRIARSYSTGNDEQQSQNEWGNSEDLNQQSQSNWDQQNEGEQTPDTLENLNQQSQNNWDLQIEGQQTQDRLENLNQQSQSNWGQQNGDQQTQDRWENLEDLNQQSQSTLDQQSDVQQSQTNWDKVEDLAQQVHIYNEDKNNLNKLEQNKNDKQFGTQSSNIVGEYSQAFETDLGFKPPEGVQIAQEHWESKHAFDTHQDPNKRIRSHDTYATERNPFKWFHNIDHITQQEFIMDPNFKIKPSAASSYSNTNYSYSNGFTKLVLNSYPHNEGITRVFRNPYRNQSSKSTINNSQITQHAQTDNSENFTNNFKITSQYSPLLKFWNKYDYLEKTSGLSTQVKYSRPDETYQIHSNIPSSSQNVLTSVYQIQQTLNGKDSTHRNKKQNAKNDKLPTLKQLLVPIAVSIDSETKRTQGPESPQDIGRGDISPEDSLSEIDNVQVSHNTSDITADKKEKSAHMATHNILGGNQTTVLNLYQQKTQKEQISENNGGVQLDQSRNGAKQNSNLSEISQQNLDKQNTLRQNFGSYKQNLNKQQQNTYNNLRQTNAQDSYKGNKQIQQHLDEFHNSYVLDYGQQNLELKIKRRDNFQQQNLQNDGKQQLTFFENNLNNIQDFGKKMGNLNVQNLHNTSEDNVQNSGRQSLEQQNINNFSRENSDPFQQQNENLEQQESHFFEEGLLGFVHENEGLKEQNYHNIREYNPEAQEDLDKDDDQINLEDHIANDYVKYIGPEDEHIEQLLVNVDSAHGGNEQVYGQQFLLPRKNENPFSNIKLHTSAATNTDSSLQVNNKPAMVQDNNMKEQYYLSEKPPLISTPEQSAVWKSLSNNFSNVKNKVAAWFNYI